MKPKKWVFYPDDPEGIAAFSRTLKVSEIISRLLINRGITRAEQARAYLRPDLKDLLDPTLLKGMEAATERIHHAVNHRQKVLIYGDFDADGITSTALLLHFFKLLGTRVIHYIPNRINEGYSFTPAGLKYILDEKVDLVISVDNGISSCEEIALLRAEGVDVIVTDHHEPPKVLPDANAIIDPKQKTCGYPFKQLSGVGVAYKLAWGVSQHLSRSKKVSPEFRQFLINGLAWVALGTITDLVPLLGENRIIARYGLPAIQNSTNPGMRALVDLVNPSQRLTAEDISFRIGPRINAAGRLGRAQEAMELFLTRSYSDAQVLAAKLDGMNKERQTIEKEIFEQVIGRFKDSNERILIAGETGWHPGVIGVVASKLVEQFGRPVILISYRDEASSQENACGLARTGLSERGDKETEMGRGSCRSVPGFDIFKALNHCSDLLESFGGHSSAGGLLIARSAQPAFEKRILEFLVETMPDQDPITELPIDCELHLSGLSQLLLSEIEKLAPFGEANPEPVFASTDLELARPAQQVGRFANHLSFIVRQRVSGPSSTGSRTFKAIAFGRGEDADRLNHAERFSLAYTPKMNFFNGRSSLELEVRDIHID